MKTKLLKHFSLRATMLVAMVCAAVTGVWAEDVTDVLDQTFTGVTGTSYTEWSGKSGSASKAVYAGQSAGGNSSIQLRSSNNNSGVVSTTSGGKVKKVTVTWNSNTADGRTLNVYGKNTAYSAATDLYNTSNQGTLLGTIVNGTSTELTVNGDYEYVGIRSASGAMYLSEVKITWAQADANKVATPDISGATSFLTSTEVSINCGTDGATIQYSTDGGTNWINYSEPFTLDATTTVQAKATKEGLTASEVASKTFTKVTPMTVAEAIAAIDEAGKTTISGQYVTGIVSQVDKYSSYKYITYWISDDGTTNNQFEVYNGLNTEGEAFSSIEDVQVGDVVVVYGDITFYSNNEVYEFSKDNQLIAQTRKPEPGLAWSADSYTANYGGSIVYPTLTNANSVAVTYDSSDKNVTTIANDGTITLKANGVTEITATFAGDETYKAQEVSYTLTVMGLLESAGISFAEETINITYNEDYDGQALTNPNSLDVTYASSNEEIAEVDEDGTILLYTAGTVTITASFAGNATYAAGSASYTLNVSKAEAGLAFSAAGPFTVAPNADFDVPTFSNPHNLTVTWTSSDEDIAIAEATSATIGDKLGTATITASFAGDERYNAAEVSYTIKVSNEIVEGWDLSTNSYESAKENEVKWNDSHVSMVANKASATTNANNYLGGSNNRTSSRFYSNSTLTITPASGYAITSIVFTATTENYATALAHSAWTNAKATASSMTVTITPTDGAAAISATIGATTGHTAVTVNLITSFPAEVTSAGYATFAAPASLDFTGKTIKAYIAKANGTTGVKFEQVTKVPANTGVLLIKEGGATEEIPVLSGAADEVKGNVFVKGEGAAVASEDGNLHNYILNNVGGVLGFYRAAGQTVAANKAYIQIDESAGVKGFIALPGFDDETAISEITNAKALNGKWYNLAGQRVNHAQKGIFIVNGKKVVVK